MYFHVQKEFAGCLSLVSPARHNLTSHKSMNRSLGLVLIVVLLSFGIAPAFGAAFVPCRIEVVEKETGWPVPLVELRTTHHERFVTDNAGVIAFDLSELMGRDVWFDVFGHG